MNVDVKVTGGVVRGGMEADLAVFRGIPYAESSARFGATVPPTSVWHRPLSWKAAAPPLA